jgi:hydroxysqualene dehydroxylase
MYRTEYLVQPQGAAGSMIKVIIVGGGLSGLAAAVRLAAAGRSVQVLEQRAQPGGRTYSFREKTSGDVVDNGQHILLDCYSRTLAYISTIGADKLIKREPELSLSFAHPQRGISRMRVPASLPPRAALMKGLAGYSFLSFTDRMKLLKTGHTIYNSGAEYETSLSDMTVDAWLGALKQSDTARRCFWYPLAIAIMNESPSHASAEVFVRSMKIAVFGREGPASIVTPLRGLTDVFVSPAVTFISKHGGLVDCNHRVTEMRTDGLLVRSVVLADGRSIEADAFILTGQPVHIQPIMETVDASADSDFSYTPIITCNIWFDGEADIPARTGMIDTQFHWAFKKNASFGGSSEHGYVSLVMSGAGEHVGKPQEELMQTALTELRSCFAGVRGLNVRHYQVIKERRATVSITPSAQKARPRQITRYPNLFLAGDWTQTHLPATIEGAILSGNNAAEMVV